MTPDPAGRDGAEKILLDNLVTGVRPEIIKQVEDSSFQRLVFAVSMTAWNFGLNASKSVAGA